jgi:hypothetical protein
MQKLLCFLSAALFILIVGVSAAFSQAGNTGFSFLKVGVGGRAMAMGEAYTAIADDPTAVFYNPADLTLANNAQVMLMHRSWIQDTQTDFLGAQTSVGDFSFGFGINATSVNDIEYREVPGAALGTFDSHNASIAFAAAYSFDSTLAVGAAVQYLYEKIFADEASGYGLNFGIVYTTPLDGIRLGASIDNLGSSGVLVEEATTLPEVIRAGAGKTQELDAIHSDLTVSAEVVSYTGENLTHEQFGAELLYEHKFAMRAGYQTNYEAKSISAGVGVKLGMLNVDYAYVPFQYDLGTTNTLSLGFSF